MPASESVRASMVATPELRFEERWDPAPQANRPPMQRILQQRWVVVGTWRVAPLDDTNSEWRDVPCVKGS